MKKNTNNAAKIHKALKPGWVVKGTKSVRTTTRSRPRDFYVPVLAKIKQPKQPKHTQDAVMNVQVCLPV